MRQVGEVVKAKAAVVLLLGGDSLDLVFGRYHCFSCALCRDSLFNEVAGRPRRVEGFAQVVDAKGREIPTASRIQGLDALAHSCLGARGGVFLTCLCALR